MDRFLFKLQVPSPTLADLAVILDRTTGSETATVSTVLNGDDIRGMRALARSVPIAPHVRDYAASLVLASHPTSANAPAMVRQFVRFGSSPRGAQAIVLAAKIKAILAGRFNVAFEDINAVATPALRHRILLNFEGEAEGVDTANVVQKIIESESASLKTAAA